MKYLIAFFCASFSYFMLAACPSQTSQSREAPIEIKCFNTKFESIHNNDDDWFSVYLTRDIPVVFEIGAKINSDQLSMRLYGEHEVKDVPIFNAENIVSGQSITITFVPTYSGTYLIRVSGSKARGRYKFALHQTWLTPNIGDAKRIFQSTF